MTVVGRSAIARITRRIRIEPVPITSASLTLNFMMESRLVPIAGKSTGSESHAEERKCAGCRVLGKGCHAFPGGVSAPPQRIGMLERWAMLIRFLHVVVGSMLLASGVGLYGGEFIHPGLLHSQSDIDRMRAAVAREEGAIYEGFQVLVNSRYSSADYRMRGPAEEWGRAPNIRTGEAQSDAKAAYENALMWVITRKQPHADKAIELINAWMGRLKRVTGIDGVLAAGLQGFKFVNAAELLRYSDSGCTPRT